MVTMPVPVPERQGCNAPGIRSRIRNAGTGVTSGSFAGGPTQPVSVNGANYLLSITSAGGDGNDVVDVYRNTVGTIRLIR
jgi:hypothetical protein